MTKKILLLGQKSFLTAHLAYALSKKYRVLIGDFTGNPLSVENTTSFSFKLNDEKWMKKFFSTIHPNLIIYLGATHSRKINEQDFKTAEIFHSTAISDILKYSERTNSQFLYHSSCNVFDGSKGNYKESDSISPHLNLGRFKANGENITKNRTSHYTILRTAPIIGKGHPKKPGFLDLLHQKNFLKLNSKIQNFELYNFCHVDDVVDVFQRLIVRGFKKEIFHYGGLTRLTHYDLALLYAEKNNLNKEIILALQKPYEKSLVNERNRLDFSLNSSHLIHECGVTSRTIFESLKINPFFI